MTRNAWTLAAALGLSLSLVACDDKGGDDTGASSDGTDGSISDGEDGTADGTDGTADGADGTDGSSGPDFVAIEGTVTLSQIEEEVALCDSVIAFSGADYAGDCDDCAFNFSVEASLAEENGSDCAYGSFSTYTMFDDDEVTTHFMSFQEEYVYAGYYADYYLENVLRTGYGVPDYGYPGPYWTFAAFSGDYTSEYASAGIDGTTFSWSFANAGYNAMDYQDFCGDYESSAATAAYGGDNSATGDVPCGAVYYDIVDAFQITVREADVAEGPLRVTVDTVSDDTAADLLMWLNGPDECVAVFADDNHDCTYLPPEYACPSLEAEVAAGTYQAIVSAYGSCADETVAEYELTVDNAAGIVELVDDWEMQGTRPFTVEINGTGELTAAE